MAAGQAVAMAPAPQSQASQALSGAQIICEYSSQFIPEVIIINRLKKERITLHILLSELVNWQVELKVSYEHSRDLDHLW